MLMIVIIINTMLPTRRSRRYLIPIVLNFNMAANAIFILFKKTALTDPFVRNVALLGI